MDTINKLLRKQAPKNRGKIAETGPDIQGGNDATAATGERRQSVLPKEAEKAPATMLRYVFDSQHGCRLGVPEEWLAAPPGDFFSQAKKSSARPGGSATGRMVEEIS